MSMSSSSSSSLDDMVTKISKDFATLDRACEDAYCMMTKANYYLKICYEGTWIKRGLMLYFEQTERFVVSKGYQGDVLLLDSIMYSPGAKKALMCWVIDYMAGKYREEYQI